MLKEISIENYKSLKNVTVQFKDGLNIIIGKNGSGKSNLLEFISKAIGTELFFNKQDLLNQRFPEHNFSYLFDYKDDLGESIELTVKLPYEVANGNSGKTILISKKNNSGNIIDEKTTFSDGGAKLNNSIRLSNGGISAGVSEMSSVVFILQKINGLLTKYLKFNIPKDIICLDIPKSITIDIPYGTISDNSGKEDVYTYLFAYGFHYILESKFATDVYDLGEENIDNVRSIILDSFEEYKAETGILDTLNLYSPIRNIRIANNISAYKLSDKVLIENITFDFKVENEWLPWAHLSDGTKRLFYLISEIVTCKNGLILIEEPELGIHPHQLFLLMNFLKEQSETKQIIVSTHSPIVLDILTPDEIDRIIIAKNTNNNISDFSHLTKKQQALAKEYMQDVADLSSYWMHSDLENNNIETL